MMKTYLKYYTQELKRNKLIFLFLFIANPVVSVFYWMGLLIFPKHSFLSKDLLIFMLTITIPLLPLIFYNSFSKKDIENMNCLPVAFTSNKSITIIIRYLSLVSIIVVFPVVNYLLAITWGPGHIILSDSPYTGEQILHFTFFSPILILAGIICAAETLHFISEKFKFVLVFVFWPISLFTTHYFLYIFKKIYIFFSKADIGKVSEATSHLIYNNLYLFIIGMFFLLFGLVIYEKFAEI